MSASGSTPNLGLPIYQNSDTPKFIPDFNSAMTAIDGGYKENKDAIAQTNTSLSQTNENVTVAQSTANQALATANLALEKLVNINDVTFTATDGFTLAENGVKVVNGVMCGWFTFTHTGNSTTVISCNYNIAGRIWGSVYDGTSAVIYTAYFNNGTVGIASSVNRLEFFVSLPWDSSWTKIS